MENIELNHLPAYDGGYVKTKIRIQGNKIYTRFQGLNVPEDSAEY